MPLHWTLLIPPLEDLEWKSCLFLAPAKRGHCHPQARLPLKPGKRWRGPRAPASHILSPEHPSAQPCCCKRHSLGCKCCHQRYHCHRGGVSTKPRPPLYSQSSCRVCHFALTLTGWQRLKSHISNLGQSTLQAGYNYGYSKHQAKSEVKAEIRNKWKVLKV